MTDVEDSKIALDKLIQTLTKFGYVIESEYDSSIDQELLTAIISDSKKYSDLEKNEDNKISFSNYMLEVLFRMARDRSARKKFDILPLYYEVAKKIHRFFGGEHDHVINIKILTQLHHPEKSFEGLLEAIDPSRTTRKGRYFK